MHLRATKGTPLDSLYQQTCKTIQIERTVDMKNNGKLTNNENGFVLAMAIFMLAICTMIGIAAMMTTTTEVDITTNEAVYRQVLYGAEAGSTIAIEALLAKEAQGTWTNG